MKNPMRAAQQHWQAGLRASQAKRWLDAAREFERGAGLLPRDALMWLNLARALMHSQRLAEASDAAQRAVTLEPTNALAVRMLAETLNQQHRYAEAAKAFASLPATAARDHDWWSAQGNALFMSGRPAEAIDAFFKALAERMDAPLVHYRMGLAFKDLSMVRESSECFRTAVSLDDGAVRALALSLLVHESRQLCDWSQSDEDTAALLAALDNTADGSGQLLSPFALLAIDATPEQQHRIGMLRLRGLTHGVQPLPQRETRPPGRIRIGYLSCDFYQHATAVLIADLLECHDRSRFEIRLYSHGTDDGSPIGQRVRAACDELIDVTHMTNGEAAARMHADALDIVIDLKGHTRGSRFELLAYRPAPVQAAFLGYPATTGAAFIDYMIGDPVVTPMEHASQYSEHIAQLPGCYQPNDRHRALPPATPRSTLGLPEDAVVLCCFNQTYKLSPGMLDLWARILHGAPRAVLWLLAWNAHAEANLKREFAARGIESARLHFAPKQLLADHLARLRAADLFLDTWPCNAHTTASEALWAGVPVLTVPGPTFASRVGASLMTAAGLPDFACASADDYVNLAVSLAQDPATLAGIKEHLNQHRLQLRPFDTPRNARDFEALLLRMFDRQQAGLPPAALPAQEVQTESKQ